MNSELLVWLSKTKNGNGNFIYTEHFITSKLDVHNTEEHLKPMQVYNTKGMKTAWNGNSINVPV